MKRRKADPPPPLEVMLYDLWASLNREYKSAPYGTKVTVAEADRPIMGVMISDLWSALKPEHKSPPHGKRKP